MVLSLLYGIVYDGIARVPALAGLSAGNLDEPFIDPGNTLKPGPQITRYEITYFSKSTDNEVMPTASILQSQRRWSL